MDERITFVGTYAIPRDGLEDWKAGVVDMVDTVKEHVPRLESYRVYLNDDSSEATNVYVHPDTESLEEHLRVAASRIGAGSQLVETLRVELYGRPSDSVLDRLHRVSEMSNGFPISVKEHFYGS